MHIHVSFHVNYSLKKSIWELSINRCSFILMFESMCIHKLQNREKKIGRTTFITRNGDLFAKLSIDISEKCRSICTHFIEQASKKNWHWLNTASHKINKHNFYNEYTFLPAIVIPIMFSVPLLNEIVVFFSSRTIHANLFV